MTTREESTRDTGADGDRCHALASRDILRGVEDVVVIFAVPPHLAALEAFQAVGAELDSGKDGQ